MCSVRKTAIGLAYGTQNTLTSLPILGPVGWKVSRARTYQCGTVVRCLRTTFSWLPHTVVSDNRKEFVSKALKDWLAAQGCKRIDTPLFSQRSNGLPELAVQTLKRSLKFYNQDIGYSLAMTLLPNYCLEET